MPGYALSPQLGTGLVDVKLNVARFVLDQRCMFDAFIAHSNRVWILQALSDSGLNAEPKNQVQSQCENAAK